MQNPLWKKLGYRAGFRACLVNPPEEYMDWVSPLPQGISFHCTRDMDMVHMFTNEYQAFRDELLLARGSSKQNGMIWISWHKKASRLPSELSEDLIRETAIEHRLVDVKVCSINQVWSGLKLVIPVRFRSETM